MLLMTQEGFKVLVEEYRDVLIEETSAIAPGVLLVRDEKNRPMPIVAGYARIEGKYFLVPIIRATFDAGEFRVTMLFGDGHIEYVPVQARQRTVRMLLAVGMYLDVPKHPLEATRGVFLRSPLYRNRVFWMEMWSGVSTVISLLIEGLPGLGITALDEHADAEMAKHSLGKDRGEELAGDDLIAAQLGHLIGFSIAWDQLKQRYPVGSVVNSEMARNVLLDAGLVIRFPEWMNQPGT